VTEKGYYPPCIGGSRSRRTQKRKWPEDIDEWSVL